MHAATEHYFTGPTISISNYDSTKTNLGSLIFQKTGLNPEDKFAGPMPIGMTRPMEASSATTAGFVHAISITSDLDWVFVADNSTAAVTRRIAFYEYRKSSSTFTWNGVITLNFVTNTGTKTIRGIRALRTTHTTGTVAVSGTTVTGTGTGFVSERIAAGARIGFGSTDPNSITQWYDIASIASNTSLTLALAAGTIAAGTPYVIEELRIALVITNATATNGGLFLVKGLNYSAFTPAAPNINEAGTVDNVRGIYWLANAATVTNTVAAGIGVDDISSDTQHFCWVLNGTTTAQIFKYDLRASLTSLTAGRSISAFIFATGISATLTGTASQNNNGRIITCNHGSAAGLKSFYFTTTTRVYRCEEVDITNGSTTFLTDVMIEIPPGGTFTYGNTNALQSVDYSDSIDRFILISSGASGIRSYVTRYNTASDPFDHIFLIDDKQFDQSTADSSGTAKPSIQAFPFSVWSEGGVLYLQRLSTAAATNQLYAMPLSSHWTFAQTNNQLLITPALNTNGATKYYRAYVNESKIIGSGTFGTPAEPYRVYFRTSGISNNSGSWTLINDTGDISGAGPANEIQFMFEFKSLGGACIPARIHSVCITYEDNQTDSHYQGSVVQSNASNRIFAWRQAVAWGSNIPNLRIRLYNATTNALILDDTVSSSTSGTWQYSTDGTTWLTWSSSADLVGNYIRYTATSLPSGIPVKALLTQ